MLAVTVLLQLAVATKGSFAADGWFGFGAIFGFGSCVAMVLVAKAAGLLLKHNKTYYKRSDADD